MDILQLVWFSYLVPFLQTIVTEIRTFVFAKVYKSVHVDSSVMRYVWVKAYVTRHCKHVHSLTGNATLYDYDDYFHNNNDLGVFGIPNGKYYIKYNNNIITVWLTNKDMWVCTIAWKDFGVLIDFIKYCKAYYKENFSENIGIKKADSSTWTISKYVEPRKLDTIVSNNKIPILNTLDSFVNNQSFYDRTGIPCKKGILMYGVPGTGKTSIITSLAKRYSYTIHVVNPENDLDIIDKVSDKTILLFEDIDRYIDPVRGVDDPSLIVEWKPRFNLQKMLNVLDGLTTPRKCIIILTANNKDIIPRVMIRPGRIDAQFNFTYATREEIVEYCKLFYETIPNKTANKIANRIISIAPNKVTISALQCYFMKYMEDPQKALENLNELIHESS